MAASPMAIEFTERGVTGGVDEASHFGLRVAVHAHAAQESETRFSPAQLRWSTPNCSTTDLIAMAKQHGTYLDI